MVRERLEENGLVRESFDTGAMPTIHVSLGALAESRPVSQVAGH